MVVGAAGWLVGGFEVQARTSAMQPAFQFQIRLDAAGFTVFDGLGPADYRFFSVALAVLGRAARARGVEFDASAALTWCAAARLLRRTPGCSPFVNSMPAASSARCKASIVRSFNASPRSNLAIVSIETFAAAASSRMPKPTAVLAIRHWIGKIIIAGLRF
jgi:hypothetical protein